MITYNLGLYIYCFREIRAYFENSYDLNDSLFSALKGQSLRFSGNSFQRTTRRT
jgi:hypothetical protein